MKIADAEIGDSFFFLVVWRKNLYKILSIARNKIAQDLNIIDEINFHFVG